MKRAQMVGQHLAGLVAHGQWGVPPAFMEEWNSVFSATKRKARGDHSATHLIHQALLPSPANSACRSSNSTENSVAPRFLTTNGRASVISSWSGEV